MLSLQVTVLQVVTTLSIHFHYRLPNCEIHKPDWGLYVAWSDWIEVERLAADQARLGACCAASEGCLDSPLTRTFSKWAKPWRVNG